MEKTRSKSLEIGFIPLYYIEQKPSICKKYLVMQEKMSTTFFKKDLNNLNGK